MISDIEQKLIDQIQGEENLQELVRVVKASKNPCFLQSYAISYNWGDGFDVPNAIVINEACDLGTALTLFWLAEGICYFTGEVKRNEYNNDWADFCDLLIEKLTSNYFVIGPVSFKPSINRVTAHKYQKSGVPSVLFNEVQGAGI
ncbi:DUF4274 domain-containing protein [Microbulbifer sp. ZKSA006]|uniref:DUF4274 domain-containing protein n=1 Tax=Microbulbifer sp. ZKSA006 TaxID=3243390 RepID=UPI00403968CC